MIHFVLPESFDPAAFLTPTLKRRHDDARYFVNLILRKFARGDVDEKGLVRLMAKHLRKVMCAESHVAVVEALLRAGVIERFPYTPGSKSYGYRLSERYVADKHVRVPATDKRLIRRLEKFHGLADREIAARMKPVHFELAKLQSRLSIDGDAARGILTKLDPATNRFDCQGISVRDIEDGEFHANVGQYGRLSNNITNLKRELRTCLHIDRRPLVSVDLSCAQPALLGKLVAEQKATQREGRGGGTKQGKYDAGFSDLELYVRLVQSGELYDYLTASLNTAGLARDTVKRKLLSDVIAKKGRYPSEIETKFRELFPTVYAFIKMINEGDHANLIRMLQREESKLVIETVAADFLKTNPGEFIIPLHDGLYSTRENVPAIEQSFQHAFASTGFLMKLKLQA